MNMRKMTSLGVVMVQEWPDASGEDDHGREGGGAKISSQGRYIGSHKEDPSKGTQFGSKNLTTDQHVVTTYSHPVHGEITVDQSVSRDKVYVGGPYGKRGGSIKDKSSAEAGKFLKDKYGIDHTFAKESAMNTREEIKQAIAEGGDPSSIKQAAHALGATDLIPDSWESWQALDGEILSEASFPQSDSHDGTASKLHDAIHGSVLAGKDMDGDGDDDSAEAKNYGPMHSVRAVHDKHVVYSMGGKNFAHKYSKDDEGDVHLAGSPVEVEPSYQTKKGPVSESCSESCAFVAEAGFDSKSGELPITIIRPGISKNNRYYSPEMLKRDCKIFEGSKMFVNHATDKEAAQRPEGDIRDWVASVKDVHAEADGTVKGTAVVFDPQFKQKIAALAETGLLKTMGVSIRAAASVSEGKMEGRSVKVIEGFKQARSVDFVTFAGAGGQPD